MYAKYASIEKLQRERKEDIDSGFKAGEEEAMHQQRDEKNFAVRNLRMREDTAKFLYNLDLNSAYYDPKSRSMRGNPNPSARPGEESYFGDNFVRDVFTYSRTRGDASMRIITLYLSIYLFIIVLLCFFIGTVIIIFKNLFHKILFFTEYNNVFLDRRCCTSRRIASFCYAIARKHSSFSCCCRKII